MLEGIKNGFRILDVDSTVEPASQSNHASSLQYRAQVEKELKEQIEHGNYVIADRKPTVVSALAAIPKENGSIRLIHDGSKPIGLAMNDYSNPESVRFQTVQDACRIAKPFYYCAKIDLASAYRSVAISPIDYKATGLQWQFEGDREPTFLFDTRLPFGSNRGPQCFHRLSQAIRRCMVRRGFKGTVTYIDDFFLAAPTFAECKKWMLVLLQLLRKLGFRISYRKVVGPCQQITFLGIQINTANSTLTLDNDKVKRLKQQLVDFSAKSRATKRQLQSLAGTLNFATQVIRGGRFFLRRILDTIAHLKGPRHKARLSSSFYSDIDWWLSFLSVFNGTVYYHEDCVEHVHVDACNAAAGAFWKGQWKYLAFDVDWPAASSLHINYKEVIAVINSVNHWAHMWKGKRVIMHTDSSVTKSVINRGWSRNKYINALLRKTAFLCARENITLRAIHVPGVLNILPDTVSRLHEKGKISLFFRLLRQWHYGTIPCSNLIDHMSTQAFLFLFSRCQRSSVK